MEEQIIEKVKQFVIKERGRYKKPLTRATLLEEDLKITGDDAWEFLENFGKQFNVNINNLDLSKYFSPEGSISLYLLVFFGKKTKKKPIALGALERAVLVGKLDDTVIEYSYHAD
jgi:hypothetical protein